MPVIHSIRHLLKLLCSLAAVFLFASCEKKIVAISEEAEAETISYEKVSFNNHVMPILSDKCFHCHGPDAKNQESDYRLDTEENAKKALEGG
ncbi:MAG: hypothetical protein ACI9E1_002392, partial [Cryomorphaceae bacterium]